MSIFNIDWNNDGKINFEDTMIDAMIIEDMEDDKKKNKGFSVFDDED